MPHRVTYNINIFQGVLICRYSLRKPGGLLRKSHRRNGVLKIEFNKLTNLPPVPEKYKGAGNEPEKVPLGENHGTLVFIIRKTLDKKNRINEELYGPFLEK